MIRPQYRNNYTLGSLLCLYYLPLNQIVEKHSITYNNIAQVQDTNSNTFTTKFVTDKVEVNLTVNSHAFDRTKILSFGDN